MKIISATTALGLACVILGLATALLWIPLDTDTWLVERARGRYTIGDSLAPTLAAAFILISGLMLMAERQSRNSAPSAQNLRYIFAIIFLGLVSLLAMRWVGPFAVALLADGAEYRLLRDTAPWKYLGFSAGGWILILGLIAFVERRFSGKAALVAAIATAAIILLYDAPFEDVLLPPNGDV